MYDDPICTFSRTRLNNKSWGAEIDGYGWPTRLRLSCLRPAQQRLFPVIPKLSASYSTVIATITRSLNMAITHAVTLLSPQILIPGALGRICITPSITQWHSFHPQTIHPGFILAFCMLISVLMVNSKAVSNISKPVQPKLVTLVWFRPFACWYPFTWFKSKAVSSIFKPSNLSTIHLGLILAFCMLISFQIVKWKAVSTLF